jgi:hypothetical protein
MGFWSPLIFTVMTKSDKVTGGGLGVGDGTHVGPGVGSGRSVGIGVGPPTVATTSGFPASGEEDVHPDRTIAMTITVRMINEVFNRPMVCLLNVRTLIKWNMGYK